MNARKSRRRIWPWLVLAAVAAATLIGSAIGKYVRSYTLEEATVTFSAKLATSITLLEHEAKRQPDGSYVLDNSKTVTSMEYTLMPGLDIPKDPHITIEGKTPIPAYLFVEVVDTTPNEAISYEMTERWRPLGITGKNGGAVYVYTADGTNPTVVDDKVGTPFQVNLLKYNQITVGQGLLGYTGDNSLVFYACMGETAFSEKTDPVEQAIEVYQKLNNMT